MALTWAEVAELVCVVGVTEATEEDEMDDEQDEDDGDGHDFDNNFGRHIRKFATSGVKTIRMSG